jgi:hypothetical protein
MQYKVIYFRDGYILSVMIMTDYAKYVNAPEGIPLFISSID